MVLGYNINRKFFFRNFFIFLLDNNIIIYLLSDNYYMQIKELFRCINFLNFLDKVGGLFYVLFDM